MRRLAAAVLVSFLLALGACGSNSSPTQASSAGCSVSGENAQILSTMQDWYYWYQSLPATANPASASSTEAFLASLRQAQPLDRFSYVTTQSADQAFYGAGQYVGYGLGFVLTSGNELQVTRVFPASPAEQAGLVRGDLVTALNGTAVPTLVASGQLDGALSVAGPGVSLSLRYRDRAGAEHAVSLVSAVITEPSVAQVSVLAAGAQSVGYIVFNSFITPSTSQLDDAFAQLAGRGVRQLVIDERYNGGGELSVAQHLASLVAGNGLSGKTLGTLTFNDKHQDQNQTVAFQAVSNALDLRTVYFITTSATASASEFIINALKPYLDVVTVGSATFGKPVGENGFDICSDVLYPITFKIENSAGFADYFGGLPATCAATDDLGRALGDPAESSLATALTHIRTGNCGPHAALAARENARREALQPRQALAYGWRRLVNAY